jgi:hypothetical protein
LNDYPNEIHFYEEDLEADSIDNWTRNKIIAMKVINQKIDFLEFDEEAVRNNEIFVPGIKMGPGHYSDTGYRFRFNDFAR